MAFEYVNTFISVAPDCPVDKAAVPPLLYRGKPTVAAMEFEWLHGRDHEHLMSEILSSVWVDRRADDHLAEDERQVLFDEYFSEGRPCFRASPLAKKYGWGFVFNDEGKVALVACDAPEYREHQSNGALEQLPAMRSSKKS